MTTERFAQGPRSFAGRAAAFSAAACLVCAFPAGAQQALSSLQSMDSYKQSQKDRDALAPFTWKSGDFKLLATTSLEFDWNDNVYLSENHPSGDFIVKPLLTLTGSYPLTDRNLLSVKAGIGYDEYLSHSELSGLRITAGSGPSFTFGVGQFTFNLHDTVNFSQDPSQQPLVAQSGEYGTFQNRAGLIVAHDFGRLSLSLGYDHLNIQTSTGEFQSQDEQSDIVLSQLAYNISSSLSAGLEFSGSFVSYDEKILNNNQNYSLGAFGDWKPDAALHIQPRVGYVIYQIDPTSDNLLVDTSSSGNINPVPVPSSSPIRTSNLDSWYASLLITHDITKDITYNFKIRHDISAGIQADLVEETVVDTSIDWAFFKKLSFTTGASYSHGTQGVGNLNGNLTESYDWYGANFATRYNLTKKIDLGLTFRFTLRASDQNQRGYQQDMVGLKLTYRPS